MNDDDDDLREREQAKESVSQFGGTKDEEEEEASSLSHGVVELKVQVIHIFHKQQQHKRGTSETMIGNFYSGGYVHTHAACIFSFLLFFLLLIVSQFIKIISRENARERFQAAFCSLQWK
jgi:hypothetical protein